MAAWIILLAIHLSLVIAALLISKAVKEDSYLAFVGFCFVPLLGPLALVIMYAVIYIVGALYRNDSNDSQRLR